MIAKHWYREVCQLSSDFCAILTAKELSSAGGASATAFARCQAACGLAQLCIERARQASGDAKSKIINDANALLAEAAKVAPNEQMVQLGKGMVLLATGNVAAAKGAFTTAKKLMCNGQKCTAATMALGQVC